MLLLQNVTDPEKTFTKLSPVGKGAFGTVYKIQDNRDKKMYAAKIIDLETDDDELEDIHREVKILSQLDSKYITRYFGSLIKGPKLWIFMELLTGGSLSDIIYMLLETEDNLEEYHIATIVREILHGLDYMHRNNRLHRDMKAANVLLSNKGEIKLCDFGVSAAVTNTTKKRETFAGTPYWMAPEVILRNSYDHRCDIWGLGITTIEMTQFHPPHHNENHIRVIFIIPHAPSPQLEEDVAKFYSKKLALFLAACLHKEPDQRPSACELLKHTWIQKYAKRASSLSDLVKRFMKWKNKQKEDHSDEEGEKIFEKKKFTWDLNVCDTVMERKNSLDSDDDVTVKERKSSFGSKNVKELQYDESTVKLKTFKDDEMQEIKSQTLLHENKNNSNSFQNSDPANKTDCFDTIRLKNVKQTDTQIISPSHSSEKEEQEQSSNVNLALEQTDIETRQNITDSVNETKHARVKPEVDINTEQEHKVDNQEASLFNSDESLNAESRRNSIKTVPADFIDGIYSSESRKSSSSTENLKSFEDEYADSEDRLVIIDKSKKQTDQNSCKNCDDQDQRGEKENSKKENQKPQILESSESEKDYISNSLSPTKSVEFCKQFSEPPDIELPFTQYITSAATANSCNNEDLVSTINKAEKTKHISLSYFTGDDTKISAKTTVETRINEKISKENITSSSEASSSLHSSQQAYNPTTHNKSPTESKTDLFTKQIDIKKREEEQAKDSFSVDHQNQRQEASNKHDQEQAQISIRFHPNHDINNTDYQIKTNPRKDSLVGEKPVDSNHNSQLNLEKAQPDHIHQIEIHNGNYETQSTEHQQEKLAEPKLQLVTLQSQDLIMPNTSMKKSSNDRYTTLGTLTQNMKLTSLSSRDSDNNSLSRKESSEAELVRFASNSSSVGDPFRSKSSLSNNHTTVTPQTSNSSSTRSKNAGYSPMKNRYDEKSSYYDNLKNKVDKSMSNPTVSKSATSRSGQLDYSNGRTNEESSTMRVIIVPLLQQLKNNKFKQSRQHSAIDELRLAFEVAEAKTPGIADRLIEKVTQRMSEYSQQGASEQTITASKNSYHMEKPQPVTQQRSYPMTTKSPASTSRSGSFHKPHYTLQNHTSQYHPSTGLTIHTSKNPHKSITQSFSNPSRYSSKISSSRRTTSGNDGVYNNKAFQNTHPQGRYRRRNNSHSLSSDE